MLTNKGYDLQSFDDVKSDLKQRFQKQFGDDSNLADDSVLGMFMNIFAQSGYRYDQLGSAVYDALFWQSANGATLDQKASDDNIFRKPATPSYVELEITAIPTTEVEEGTQFSTEDGHIFKTLESISIDKVTTHNDGNGFVVNDTDDDGNQVGKNNVQAISDGLGSSENVLSESIIYADNLIDGLVSVINPNGATGGSDEESDDELRNRGIRNNIKSTKGTMDSIENAVLNVPGVQGIKPIVNKTLDKDQYGNPPKSVHIYVIGGDDTDVAKAIYSQLYMTTQTVGNKSVNVKDLIGDNQTINFDEAKTKPIYIKIHLDIDNATFNTDSSPDYIKQKIMAYFDELTMGDSVLYSRLFAPAFSASGVKNVTIELGTDSNSLSQTNVDVDQFELPQISKNNITIDW